MKRPAIAFFILTACLFIPANNLLSDNLPTQIEALRGTTWIGNECCRWEFAFSHKSGPFFRGEWKNPNGQRLTDNNIIINIIGDDRVEIIRGGGSSAGGCTYTGTIHVGGASGQYSCAGRYAGTWSAVIR